MASYRRSYEPNVEKLKAQPAGASGAGDHGMGDVEKWREIEAAWIRYATLGATIFDWDFDSRPLMERLTGVSVSYWGLSKDELAQRRHQAGYSDD